MLGARRASCYISSKSMDQFSQYVPRRWYSIVDFAKFSLSLWAMDRVWATNALGCEVTASCHQGYTGMESTCRLSVIDKTRISVSVW